MNLNQLRANLLENLHEATGVPCVSWEDKAPMPPCVILNPGDPYVDGEGETSHGSPYAVHYVIQYVAGRGDSDTVAAQLDDALAAIVLAIVGGKGEGFGPITLDGARGPLFGEIDGQGRLYCGGEVAVTIPINLKG